MPIFPIVFMLFVLPFLIIQEGYKMLKGALSRPGFARNFLYILVLLLALVGISLFLAGF
ncbi:MAG: hypothetical protein AAB500_02130 [Patescibacteria group bacterium]